MLITLRNQALKALLLLACLVILVLHLALPINLTAVDIGRHIKNGQLIVHGQTQVLYKNYYSFTFPDYPFINHHWFFGVISYVIYRLSGFDGLSIAFIGLLLITFLIAFDSARRYSNFIFALFFGVLSILLISSRAEIRPEGFSVFLVALDFWLLQRFLQRSITERALWLIIPAVQVLWVNTHIFFLLGPVLIGLFWWQAKLEGESQGRLGFLKKLFWLSVMVNLINPSGLEGMLTPLNGFKKFGYDLAENQPVFFMIHRFPVNIIYKYYLVVAVVMMVGMIIALLRDRIKALPMVVLGIFITIVAFRVVRLIMPFGFLFIPLAAYYYSNYIKKKAVVVILGIASLAGIFVCAYLRPDNPQIGLMPNVNASAEFFKKSGLKGPIFSNYDIGGYLIYHLSGQEKVFVDNRQEAFPIEFFRKVYVPMQEDYSVWWSLMNKYQFNVIYFYRRDMTPWGQPFLVRCLVDPMWQPVFVDNYVIIYARKGSVNQGVIDRFGLPTSMFSVINFK